jgi:hypothetical protein
VAVAQRREGGYGERGLKRARSRLMALAILAGLNFAACASLYWFVHRVESSAKSREGLA